MAIRNWRHGTAPLAPSCATHMQRRAQCNATKVNKSLLLGSGLGVTSCTPRSQPTPSEKASPGRALMNLASWQLMLLQQQRKEGVSFLCSPMHAGKACAQSCL